MKIYILQYLDSLLDYSSLEVYTDRQEAIEAFTLAVAQAKVEGWECYKEETSISEAIEFAHEVWTSKE